MTGQNLVQGGVEEQERKDTKVYWTGKRLAREIKWGCRKKKKSQEKRL